ncbi:MAG: exonuclease SbcCD subunit D, partial [Candidatus Thorarchaeota archaeon]
MRILATADSHFGYIYGRTAQAKNLITQHFFDSFENLLNIARKEKADLVLHGGDFFNRSKPKKYCFAKAFNLIAKLSDDEFNFVAIPGNHDRSYLPDTLLSHFRKNIFFLNSFSIIEIDDITIIGFPYSNDPISIMKKISRYAKNNPSKRIIILCHQLFDGATFGPHNYVFTKRFDTLLTYNLPRNIKFVVSGHIHRAQSLQNNKVFYPGSIGRTSFMEIVEPKGYLIIDVEDDFHSTEFCEIPSIPMEVKEVEIHKSAPLSSELEKIEIDPNVRFLLRLVGRILTENE